MNDVLKLIGKPSSTDSNTLRLLAITAVSIFVVEFAIMSVLPILPQFPRFLQNIVDAGLLVLIVFPALYYFAFKPSSEQEVLFNALAQNSPDCIKLYDRNGKLLFINEVGLKEHGYASLEDALVHDIAETLVPESQEVFRNAFAAAMRGEAVSVEVQHAKGSTNRDFCLETLAPLRDASGEIVSIMGVSRDISSRRRMEEELRESEMRYRMLAETTPDMVFVIGRDDRVLYMNTFAARQFGKRPEEVIGRTRSDLFPPDIAEQQAISLQRVFKSGQTISNEEPLRLDGHELWINSWLVPMRDESGAVTAVMGISRDITERKKNEVRLRESAEELRKFKMAIEAASDHIILTDDKGVILYVNKDTEDFIGYSREELIGKTASVWGGQMPKEFYDQMWRTIREEKKPYSAELINRRKNGERYDAELHISPVLNESGDIQYFIGVERDITRAKEIDKAKDEFISLASHQMRTPLTAINWYVEMLLDGDGGKLSAKQKEYFQAIRTAGQQINEIIKSFLYILRLEAGTVMMNPVSVNLEDVIHTALKESQLDIEKKKLQVVERYQEALPTMSVDMELIRVVMQNLISNAIKYTPTGGEVTVAVQSVSQGETVAEREVGQSSVLVSARDTGIGIPQTDRDKIFTKFFRSESAKHWDPNGNGIGLYMTKKMVDTIGGVIWFDSEEGKGTTFYVLLPVEEKKADTIPA